MIYKEMLKSVWPLLEKSAPFVASLIGAPYASIPAMMAMHSLATRFGLDVENVSGLPDAMQADPDCADKLTSLESFFAKWLQGTNGQWQLPTTAEINIKLGWNNQSNNS
jgi:hypothetical protein